MPYKTQIQDESIESIKDIKEQLAEALEVRERAIKRVYELRMQIAMRLATLAPGERARYGRKGELVEITKILPGYADGSSPRYFGRKVRINGELHRVEIELWKTPLTLISSEEPT